MRALDAVRSVWSRTWDGTASPLPLALFRVGIAVIVLVRTNDWLRPIVRLDHHGWVRGTEYLPSVEAVLQPALHAPLLPLPVFAAAVATVLVHARTALAVLLLLGIAPRVSAGLLGIAGYALMAADRFRYMHHLHLLWVSCLLLALAPSGERLSVVRFFRRGADAVPRWPLQILRLQLLVAYAGAGVAKVSIDWLSGGTLARYEESGLVGGDAWQVVSTLGHAPAAIGVAAFELGLVPLLAFRRTRLAAVAAALVFHALLHASMMLSVFTAIMSTYLALFLPWREDPLDEAAAPRGRTLFIPAGPEARLLGGAHDALERARDKAISYSVRVLAAPGEDHRLVVVLGEAHLKLAKASALGREIVGHFELRGVESFQRREVIAGNVLWLLVHVPRLVLRALSLGRIAGSTITDAKIAASGRTVELEKAETTPIALHAASLYLSIFMLVFWTRLVLAAFGVILPGLTLVMLALELHLLALVPAFALRRKSWSWIVHPALGLITSRDALMAEGTVRMLRDHPSATSILVIMGRAHVRGYERELVENHGFRRVAS